MLFPIFSEMIVKFLYCILGVFLSTGKLFWEIILNFKSSLKVQGNYTLFLYMYTTVNIEYLELKQITLFGNLGTLPSSTIKLNEEHITVMADLVLYKYHFIINILPYVFISVIMVRIRFTGNYGYINKLRIENSYYNLNIKEVLIMFKHIRIIFHESS